jgi:tetratricopeptide (TPR) repeat protein
MTIGVKAQLSYKIVDSTSYALYSKQQWETLTKYGEQVDKEGFDYYYLNLRIGIANYELGRFYKAEKYFEKAQQNNNSGKVAPKYLFWIYNQTDREPEAAEMYKLLPDSTKLTIDYSLKKIIESVYLEVGPKFSSNKNIAGTILYTNIGLKHKFSPNFNLYHNYTYMENNLIWGNYKQHQYNFAPTLNLKNAWKIGLGFNYFQYKSNVNYSYETRESINLSFIMGSSVDTSAVKSTHLEGDYSLNAFFGQINFSKTYKRFSFKPQLGLYKETSENNLEEIQNMDTVVTVSQFGQQISSNIIGTNSDTLLHPSNEKTNHLQLGTGIDYTSRFNKNSSITIGAEFHAILFKGSKDFILTPYFSLIVSKKFGLSGYYMSKGNYPISFFGGSTVINSYDKLNHRISLTARFGLSKRASIYSTFQFEEIKDNFSLATYKSYSILTGIKIKF